MPNRGEIFQIKVGDKLTEAKWIGEIRKLDGTILWVFQNGEVWIVPASRFISLQTGKPSLPLAASLKG